ncbi:A type inclusion-like/fusion protein [Turkeypox virus]|uniref:A type inclusion-like/fusion protein n=1 Tax=Turkeypox virus TaxID=336486 RepID=A0A0M3ZPP6_9POXV|nr:A type inclusion-like/fusion protein [Turkeypox virus]ALA62514.1 A type inclusion-like/fusion protein [Turkeypox virus]
MGRDKCGVTRCISKFESLIINTWDHDLTPRSFLTRKDRKIIRNIFRCFIHYSCNDDLINGVQSQLLYPKILDNYFLGEFIKHNNQGIKKLYNKIDMSNDRIPDISTKGKYIVYAVMYLLYMGNNNITFNYNDSERTTSKKISDIVSDYLRIICGVHARFGCKCMFIGIPMYYIYLMSADDIITAIESISNKPSYGPEEYKRGNSIHMKEMCAYEDFFNYILASKKAKKKGLYMSLCGIYFETDYSISELIMDGLCYCFTDEIYVKQGYYEYVQLYTKCHIGDTYEYLRLTDEYPTSKMSFSANCDYDCSAIRIYKDKDKDFYQNRHMLFFPDDCSKWKWYLDDDKRPSYDYSNDRERRPRDYHEFYIDNTECDLRKNCKGRKNGTDYNKNLDTGDTSNDIIKDEAPALNRGICSRRRYENDNNKHRRDNYKYDVYEDENPRSRRYGYEEDVITPKRSMPLKDSDAFGDEMMYAVNNDDYTPTGIRRRNRYVANDDDRYPNEREDKYYYDRGYSKLGVEKDVYKPHPDKDRVYDDYPPRRPSRQRSNQEMYNDAVENLNRLERDNFKDSYKKIKDKMDKLEDDYEDLRKHAIELPKKLDKQTDNVAPIDKGKLSWF